MSFDSLWNNKELVLSAFAAFVVVCIGATFAITRYANDEKCDALRERLNLKDDQISNYGKSIEILQESKKIPVESPLLNEGAIDDETSQQLIKLIKSLEAEKEQLIDKLSVRVTDSLDPKSEISNLITQMGSRNQEKRHSALNTLFQLRDPASYPALSKYIITNGERATNGGQPGIFSWVKLLLEIGGDSGVSLVVGFLESDYYLWSEVSIDYLNRFIDATNQFEALEIQLRTMALTSESTTARTSAKLLLKKLNQRIKTINNDKAAEETNSSVVTDEKLNSSLEILFVLNKYDLTHLSNKLITDNVIIEYWRTGLLIYANFEKDNTQANKCLSALSELSKQPYMNESSRIVLMSLMMRIYHKMGEQEKADEMAKTAKNFNEALFDQISVSPDALDPLLNSN